MTAYIIAYPHPSIPRRRTIRRFDVGMTSGEAVIERVIAIHPDLRDDLGDAALWKVGQSSAAQLPPRPPLQASGFASSDVISESKASIYGWIKEREKHRDRDSTVQVSKIPLS